MASRLTILIDLLHSPGEMSLATHSVTLPGFPFVTAVPFATDEHHRPVMLLSRLAEHTKNLLDDSRTSVLMAKTFGGGEMARVTMLGTIVEFEPHSEMTARTLWPRK